MSMFDAKRPIRLLAPVALAALLVVGLSACEDPPTEPGKPVLQIHGTKPPSIDLWLEIKYAATTDQRQCQEFTMRTMEYVPMKPDWHVWTHEPPSEEPNRRDRVVPMDTTGTLPDSLIGKDLEAFRWSVNAGWVGEPAGCEFEPRYAVLEFRYGDKASSNKYKLEKSEEIGRLYVNMSRKECKKSRKSERESIDRVICKWGGFNEKKEIGVGLECRVNGESFFEYCPEEKNIKKIDLKIPVRYVKNK